MLTLSTRLLPFLLAATLAAPAAAGTLFKWTGADGSVSFTDEAKRIPERYRSQAVAIQTGGLSRYARFTPTDAAAQAGYQERLQARLERLREARAARARNEGAHPAHASPQVPSEMVVRVNDDTAIRVPMAVADEGPVVVEEVRVRRQGSNFTIHNTVVRQGDRILLVVRPAQSHQAGPNDFIDEAELFD